MDKPVNVCVLVGSLRKASFNRRLAKALISLVDATVSVVIFGLFPGLVLDLIQGPVDTIIAGLATSDPGGSAPSALANPSPWMSPNPKTTSSRQCV